MGAEKQCKRSSSKKSTMKMEETTGEKDERYTTENMKERNFRRGGMTYLMRDSGSREYI